MLDNERVIPDEAERRSGISCSIAVLSILFFTFLPSAGAQTLQVADIFTDNMVLQQNDSVQIWGWSARSESIAIIPSWGDTVFTNADAGARWKAKIHTPEGDYTPRSIIIQGDDPKETIILRNVLIGEVWLASGQSNMYWPTGRLNIDDIESELSQKEMPRIRSFNVNLRASEYPQEHLFGSWAVCTPDMILNTSAAGYFFAKNLNESLDVPIGLIVDAWGGTPIEFWYPFETFKDDPELVESAERIREQRVWPTSDPGAGYNAMTYPIGNYSIAGIIWYQGEANVFDPLTYARKMEILVSERRKQFGENLPFYFVQIAPYQYTSGERKAAELREQQTLSLKIPNTGMVVVSDIGDTTNIHPKDKKELGRRLANLALKHHYKTINELVDSPIFKSAKLIKNHVYVDFHNSEGLHFTGKERGYFEVAGQDGNYMTVKAEIIDNKVRLDTRKISQPQWVRFAFTNTATPVLFNGAGLPASCFAPNQIKDHD